MNMRKEKQFLVSERCILSEVAKWAVAQSPYEGFGKRSNKNLSYEEFTYRRLIDFFGIDLKRIPEFLLWNERKNGNQQYKFTDRYSKNDNPDDDFTDLDALIRNIANFRRRRIRKVASGSGKILEYKPIQNNPLN